MNVAGKPKELFNEAISANGDTFSSAFKLTEDTDGMYIACDISGRTDGSYTLTLQHSFDGTNWYDLQSTTAQTADGQAIAKITEDTVFFNLRLKLSASAVTTGATSVKGTLIS